MHSAPPAAEVSIVVQLPPASFLAHNGEVKIDISSKK